VPAGRGRRRRLRPRHRRLPQRARRESRLTLLERLDAAERVLVEAMALPVVPPDVQPWDDWAIVTAEWKAARCATINSASARCMAAAARAIVSVEDVPE
jgi:hypothetical protein